MVTHLMRHKKNSALGVKFLSISGNDQITNMEGALHTYVTPIVPAFLHGDYRYHFRHGVVNFPDVEAQGKLVQQARRVVVSASVQPDFEGGNVMLHVCALGKDAVEGRELGDDFEILDVAGKHATEQRDAYDTLLRAHMIYHLTANHRLPSLSTAALQTVELTNAITYLESQIVADNPDYDGIRRTYVRLRGSAVVSLELLVHSAAQQLRNEISGLEVLCPQGYILTIDPPAIFARQIGAELLNRLQFVALRWLADGGSTFERMRAFAFNDYADPPAVRLLVKALKNQPHVKVMKKVDLFPGPQWFFVSPPGMEGALLVVHNNSDAFGQNIETESEGGSLDGAIGVYSSAAASLSRKRGDLLEKLM